MRSQVFHCWVRSSARARVTGEWHNYRGWSRPARPCEMSLPGLSREELSAAQKPKTTASDTNHSPLLEDLLAGAPAQQAPPQNWCLGFGDGCSHMGRDCPAHGMESWKLTFYKVQIGDQCHPFSHYYHCYRGDFFLSLGLNFPIWIGVLSPLHNDVRMELVEAKAEGCSSLSPQ